METLLFVIAVLTGILCGTCFLWMKEIQEHSKTRIAMEEEKIKSRMFEDAALKVVEALWDIDNHYRMVTGLPLRPKKTKERN